MLEHFLTYPANIAVTVPWIITIMVTLVQFRNRGVAMFSSRDVCLWVLATFLSVVFARWEMSDEAQSLYITPFATIAIVVLVYLKDKWTPSGAYAITFTSFWATDMIQAWRMKEVLMSDVFFYGVGGAGWMDGLVIVPALTAGVVAYANWRRGMTA